MEGGAGQEGKETLGTYSINTLANTMKHCINVSNYWQDGKLGRWEGWGDERMYYGCSAGCQSLHQLERKERQSKQLWWGKACVEMLHDVLLREINKLKEMEKETEHRNTLKSLLC